MRSRFSPGLRRGAFWVWIATLRLSVFLESDCARSAISFRPYTEILNRSTRCTRRPAGCWWTAVLADIGVNSSQIEVPERGFSFSLPGPLDMRMNPEQSQTAADFVNYSSERDLANLIDEFGEERYSRRIARALVKARPLRTTTELAQVVTRTIPSRAGLHQFSGRGGRPQPRRLYRRLHPATRVFQALRIAVNRELDVLATFLKKVPEVLAAGGRLVVISFHSLEDRIVKQTFQGWRQDGSFRLLTRKVVRPAVEEIRGNPRSRSARLRAAEKV